MINKSGLILSSIYAVMVQAADEAEKDVTYIPNDRPAGGYQVGDAEFNMRYLKETDQVEFTVTMLNDSWFALALGNGNMTTDGDMLSFHRNSVDYYYEDRVSLGYQPPGLDMT